MALGTWVVGNPKDPGGGTDFEMLSLILSMLFQKRCPVSQQLGLGAWR